MNRSPYGYGAIFSDSTTLIAGHVILIAVGQGSFGYQGAGGTFIYNNTTNTLLFVAGGAGGLGTATAVNTTSSAQNGQATTYGAAGYAGSAGGTNGNTAPQNGGGAGGGGGYYGGITSTPSSSMNTNGTGFSMGSLVECITGILRLQIMQASVVVAELCIIQDQEEVADIQEEALVEITAGSEVAAAVVIH